MIALISLLLACGEKSTDDTATVNDSENTEENNTNNGTDTDTEETTDPTIDNDGDGVIGADDCDDLNPWVTEDCGRACSGDFHIEVDDDLALVAGCGTIDGNLNLEGITQENLIALNGLESVTGYFWIFRGHNLVNLKGLNKLKTVGDGFILSYNDNITSVDGLESLTDVGSSMSITNNPMLTDLDGLNGLKSIERSLLINSIPVANLDAFNNVESFGASIYISECDNLESVMGLATSVTSFGEHESIGTYDADAGGVIESLFYVYLNDNLCQDDVEATATLFADQGWEGRLMGYDNNGSCQ
jgi:hypothetical protein